MSNDNQCVFEHQRERCTMPRVYCDTPMGTRGFCHHHRPEENRDHGMEQEPVLQQHPEHPADAAGNGWKTSTRHTHLSSSPGTLNE